MIAEKENIDVILVNQSVRLAQLDVHRLRSSASRHLKSSGC